MELKGWTIESVTIKDVDEEHFRGLVVTEELDLEYDAHLSDMSGETVIIEPDGTVHNPYGGTTDLLQMLRPLLDQLPLSFVERYVVTRGLGK